MQLKPQSAAMVVLLAVLISIGPLSTDMYLPSLPWIAQHFEASGAQVQLTLSSFLIGLAIGQLVYGPLSDRHGRRPVLMAGLAIYVAATALCAFAVSIETLIVARFAQAIGACAGIVLARAIVRDLYSGAQAARLMSIMSALMGAVPAVAPVIGAVLQEAFGWRSNFTAVVVAGSGILAAVALMLPETNTRPTAQALSLRGTAQTFRSLLAERAFRLNVAAASLSYGGLFAFISASSFIFQETYGLQPLAFGLCFAVAVLGYIVGTLIGARITMRLGTVATLGVGAFALAIGGGVMLALVALAPPNFLSVLVPTIIYMAGVGLVLPQAMAGALTPFPESAGTASSGLGFLQMTSGALVGIGVGHMLDHGPIVLAATMAVLAVLCVAVAGALRRGRVA